MRKNLCTYVWYIYVSSSVFSKSAATSLRSLSANTNFLTLATKNLSSMFPDLPDNNYGYSAHYFNPVLSATACMMLCVFAMRDLALQDFESRFEGKTWAMYSYPETKVSFTPSAGDINTVRWALWGMAAAIRDMMVRNRFQTAQYDTTYMGIQVGVVKFFAPHRIDTGAKGNLTELVPSLTSGPASATNHTDTTFISLNDPNGNVASSNSDDLWTEVTFRTTEIPIEDTFMSIVQALLNLGPLNSTALITQPLAVIGDALTVKIVTSFKRVERSTPPFFNYGHVVKGLAGLPRVMLRENKFTEVDLRLIVDGENVGNGRIRKRPMYELVFPVTVNVSVS